MPSTSAGYTLPPIYRATPGTTIRAEQHNIPFEDVAQGINDSIARDGSRPPTANLTMNSRKITSLGPATENSDAVNLSQLTSTENSLKADDAILRQRFNTLTAALNTAMNSACPVGMVAWHNGLRSSIPSGWLPADGQSLTRATWVDLWAWANAQAPIADSTWQGADTARVKYSTGNGSTTFRAPDLNGVQSGSLKGLFLRGSSGGTLQNAQGDTIRNITGEFGMKLRIEGTGDGAFEYLTSGSVTSWGSSGSGAEPTVRFDASRVVPTSTENRPVSAVGVWIIRATAFNFSGI